MTKPGATNPRTYSFRNLSIQKRLPLLIFLLLLFVITIYGFTSYEALKTSAIHAGRDRLLSLAEQFGTMLQQSVQGHQASTRTIMRHEPLRSFLEGKKADSVAALQRLHADSSSIHTALFDAQKNPLLQSSRQGTKFLPPEIISGIQLQPDSVVAGRFYLVGDTIYFPIAGAIADSGKLLGYVIRWRRMQSNPRALEQITRLVGAGAELYVGNRDGSLWTNLVDRVEGPPRDMEVKDSVINYSRDGKRMVAASQLIGSTNWQVLVEFPRKKILEPLEAFVFWMLLIGAVLIAAGTLVAWLMSRNITGPLKKLTESAGAIADGDYTHTVEIKRQDELGQLGQAFNTMSVHVREAQEGLEHKVKERTIELENMRKAAEKASDSKTRFLSSMSHEIRTPLNGILGFTEILSRNNLTEEERKEYLEHIRTAGDLLTKLIGDILDLNKIEEGKLSLDNESFHVKEYLESGLHPYKYKINENGIDFKLDIDPKLPDYIIGDRHRINQLLVNLIGNASKFTREGVIGIKVTGDYGEGDSYVLRMSVYDSGIGIPKDKFSKIFESFSQASESIGRHYGGSGLGLAIAKQLVSVMNGTIEVISPYVHGHPRGDSGSCFEIKLPVQVDKTRRIPAKGEKSEKQIASLQGRDISVLVVDDNIMNQKLAGFMLEKLGCRVEFAGNGQEAIDMIPQNGYDIILMDVHMPVMDGYEATREIRKNFGPDMPIIGVTANVFKEDVNKCLEAGMNDHLGKPYQEEQLGAKIVKWMGGGKH